MSEDMLCAQVLREGPEYYDDEISGKDSWELFYKVMEKNEEGYAAVFKNIPGQDDAGRKNLEIELFTIIEMVSAVSYSVILTSDPVSLEEFLPYLHRSIRAIVASFHK